MQVHPGQSKLHLMYSVFDINALQMQVCIFYSTLHWPVQGWGWGGAAWPAVPFQIHTYQPWPSGVVVRRTGLFSSRLYGHSPWSRRFNSGSIIDMYFVTLKCICLYATHKFKLLIFTHVSMSTCETELVIKVLRSSMRNYSCFKVSIICRNVQLVHEWYSSIIKVIIL